MSELGFVLPAVPAVLIVTDWLGSTVDSANFTLHTKPIETARINVDQMKVWENYNLSVDGENFTANSDVTLNFNDVDIKTVTTNSSGGFATSIPIPQTDLGSYYLEAVDGTGNLGIMILDIINDPNPPISTTSTTLTSVATTQITSPTQDTSSTTSTTQEEDNTDDGINFPIVGFLTAFVVIFTYVKRRRNR